MLRQRVITAAILLPLFIGAVFFLPPLGWGIFALLLAAPAAYEWGRLVSLKPAQTWAFTAAVSVSCLTLLALNGGPAQTALLAAGALFWFVAAPWMLVTRDRQRSTPLLLSTGWLVLVSAWLALVVLQENAARMLVLVGVVWVADSAAYFAGRRFGRRKLAPTISPGKTWEGVAGAVLAVAVYYLIVWIVVAAPFVQGSPLVDAVLVVMMTVLSIEGDLFESWLKRRVGVKDSGTILPGHGGMLDRIDAVLAVVPLAALVHVALRT
jgi:phosphatidate cytidylyltransferase